MIPTRILCITALLLCLYTQLTLAPVEGADALPHAGLADAAPEVCFKCHKDLATPPEGGVVHAAFGMGDCSICHLLGADNRFQLIDTGAGLCYMCHDAKNTQAKVHSPVASGDCILCHNPHQSPNPKMLMDYPVNKLCFNCHDEAMAKHAYVHVPVSEGECTSCHDPHQSPHDKQLREEGNNLCLMCHADKEEDLKTKKHVHEAVEMVGCTGCHSPHASDTKYQLLSAPPDLCYTCHSDKEGPVKTPHGAIEMKGSCVNCHDPHASDHEAQLKAAENKDLCLKCHDRRRKTKSGYILNMKAHLEKNPEHHGPILMGDCASCHNPHGSDEWRMLKKPFPAEFYVPFKLERYGLCFECHDESLVLDENTTANGFRNGEMNLHFVHVSDPRKGRRCVVCHDAHAAQGPKHVRETAKFGSWDLPIRLELLEDGGRCAPGCHLPRAYNRSKPVKNR